MRKLVVNRRTETFSYLATLNWKATGEREIGRIFSILPQTIRNVSVTLVLKVIIKTTSRVSRKEDNLSKFILNIRQFSRTCLLMFQ